MKEIQKIVTNDPEFGKELFGFVISPKQLNNITKIIQSYDFGAAITYEDVLSEFILKLMEDFKVKYDKRFASLYISPYLYLIASRFCKDKYKYEKRRVHKYIELPSYFNSMMIDHSKSQDARLEFDFLLQVIPNKHKKIIELNYLGYDHKEIAKRMNISIPASRKRLERARNWLRKYLNQIIINNNQKST